MGDADPVMIEIAQAAAFMSPTAITEANDIGCAAAWPFVISEAVEMIDPKVFCSKRNYSAVERSLSGATMGRDRGFLPGFIGWSMRKQPIECRPNDIVWRCMAFWIEYGDARGIQ